jgi:hypothetical protein
MGELPVIGVARSRKRIAATVEIPTPNAMNIFNTD